jgi:hypothetical protein
MSPGHCDTRPTHGQDLCGCWAIRGLGLLGALAQVSGGTDSSISPYRYLTDKADEADFGIAPRAECTMRLPRSALVRWRLATT